MTSLGRPKSHLGTSWDASGVAFGRPWAPLGRPWDALGRLWGGLGTAWGTSGVASGDLAKKGTQKDIKKALDPMSFDKGGEAPGD